MRLNLFRRPKTAAVQSSVTTSAGYRQGLNQPWAERARFFAEHVGLVSFAQEMASMAGSRVDWLIQQRQPDGEWVTVQDDGLTGLLSWYRNDWQTGRELLQQHLYRVGVDGERYEVMAGRADGSAGFFVVPTPRVTWRGTDTAAVQLAPNANERDQTLLIVPAENIHRQWTPGKNWPLLAWSPMFGVMEDLERYWSLVRLVRRSADSRLTMNKILIMSEEAHDAVKLPQIMQGGQMVENPQSQLDIQFQQAAAKSFADDDSLAALTPFMYRQADKLKAPTVLDLAPRGLDPNVIAAIADAGRAVAVGLPLPASIILAEDANHWNEWLMQERAFQWAIAPPVERVCNDVTGSFLRPTLAALKGQGQFGGDPGDFRIWYDPTPVLVHPDQTAHALELHTAGLLAALPTLESYGYDEEDMMGEPERAGLIEFLKATKAAPVDGGPVGPGNVEAGPPALPIAASMPNPFEAEQIAWFSRK